MVNKSNFFAHLELNSEQKLVVKRVGEHPAFTTDLPRSCSRALYTATSKDQCFYIRGRIQCESPLATQTFIIEQITPV
ncbi:MAG: hypothetical protein ACRCZG_02090 [Culicoidibacterales bacterium]